MVRMVTVCTAMLVVAVYTSIGDKNVKNEQQTSYHSRNLLHLGQSNEKTCDSGDDSNGQDNANCTDPFHHGNESCQFVEENCSDDVALANYLGFIACDLPHVKVLTSTLAIVLSVSLLIAIRICNHWLMVALSHLFTCYYSKWVCFISIILSLYCIRLIISLYLHLIY